MVSLASPIDRAVLAPADTAPILVTPAGSAAEWDAYVEAHPDATADHLWAWGPLVARVFRHAPAYLAARRGGRLVGVLPLVKFRSPLFGRALISLPFLNDGGVLADDDAAAEALVARAREIAAEAGASHVELRHRRRQFPALPCREHKLSLVRPLPSSSDALWQELDRKVRNQVRKAQKEGLEAAAGGRELVPAFYRVFAENMRDLGTPVYAKRLFDEVLTAFGDRARVHVVRRGATVMAAAVTIAFRRTVLVPWASSLKAYRTLCPNMLLYWSMLERAVADGMTTFDFGRSTPGAGTHQFKLQWGAVARPLCWEYVLLSRADVPDHGPTNTTFTTAIALWQHLPLRLATTLGPHIVRGIP
ncbi:MAG: FemAB family PEP-CTERM system-associated protein [Acidobacteria bacterium]|nr:FemAB family PEP-CTERM system-associated protein [Acidobacteriota bacterium]